MSVSQRPPIPSLIPESAPFTPEQRTWLNGLFAGLFGLPENVTPVSSADAAKLLAGLLDGAAGTVAPPGDAETDDGAAGDDAPWPRSGNADAGPYETRRWQTIAPPPHGGDGATGLRSVRL